jgi:predicted nuclease with RNAse H fold
MYLVAGLDLAAGRGVSELAFLRVENGARPAFDPAGHAPVVSDDEIVGELARRLPRVLAIDAPLSLPRAVMSALTPALPGEAGEASNLSPYTRAAERDPIWSALGVRPFPVSFLGGITFRALVLVARLRAVLPGTPIIETFPTAVFRALDMTGPANATRRAPKQSIEARTALQTRLQAFVNGVPTPDQVLLGVDLLDALGAALAALAFDAGAFVAVGNEHEGQIILPKSLTV